MKKSKTAINPVPVPESEMKNELNLDDVDLDLDDFNDFSFEDASSVEFEALVSEFEIDTSNTSEFEFLVPSKDVEARNVRRRIAEMKILNIRDDLIRLLDNIEIRISRNENTQGLEVASDLSAGYRLLPIKYKFYLPLFIFDLLTEYELSSKAADLNIFPPEYAIKGDLFKFDRKLIMSTGNPDFIYSCSFRRSLKNYFENIPLINGIGASILEFVESIHGLDDDNADSCKCGSEHSIRNSVPVCINRYEYINISKKLTNELSIKYIDNLWR